MKRIIVLLLLMLGLAFSCTSSNEGVREVALFSDNCDGQNVRYGDLLDQASENNEEIVKRCGFPFPKRYLEKIESFNALSNSSKVPEIGDDLVLVRWWDPNQKEHMCEFRGAPRQKIDCEELIPILFPKRNCILSPHWLDMHIDHLCGNLGVRVSKP